MSRILDPSGGDGPNKGGFEPSEGDQVSGSAAEENEGEGRGEGGRGEGGRGEGEGGGRQGGEGTQTSSKGINPVQHSE